MVEKHKKKLKIIWWVVLVGAFSYYFFTNYDRIVKSPNPIDNAILIALLLLVFMPLVSEISAFGMSVKKEVQDAKDEMKKEVSSIRNDIIQFTLCNANSQKVYVGLEAMPSTSEVNEAVKTKDSNTVRDNNVDSEPKIVKGLDLSEEQIKLYKIRFAIESKVKKIAKYQNLARYENAQKLGQTLWRYGVISDSTYDKMKKVLTICNRGVHGELIEKSYIEYAINVSDEINDDFEEILKREPRKV